MANIPVIEGTDGYESIVYGTNGETHDIVNATNGLILVATRYDEVVGAGGKAYKQMLNTDNAIAIAPGNTRTATIDSGQGPAFAGTLVVMYQGATLNTTATTVKA